MAEMAFIHSTIDRKANHRSNDAWLHERSLAPNAKYIQIRGDGVRLAGKTLVTERPEIVKDFVFLGEDAQSSPWFAVQAESETGLSPLRPLMVDAVLPPDQLSAVAQARSLIHWHERHGFCAACGHKTEMADAGYRRHCPSCGADHFPRTDPVVIMAVRHDDRILLGRQKSWAPGMYSAIAGFMEPGETIEQAVAREVKEETGVLTGAVRYVTSQPWPFPSTLMIGCVAEAKATAISLDDQELEQARWFARDEVRLMLAHQHPEKLYASNPYAIAHYVVTAALDP